MGTASSVGPKTLRYKPEPYETPLSQAPAILLQAVFGAQRTEDGPPDDRVLPEAAGSGEIGQARALHHEHPAADDDGVVSLREKIYGRQGGYLDLRLLRKTGSCGFSRGQSPEIPELLRSDKVRRVSVLYCAQPPARLDLRR